jgi:AAA+ superfamily predicted ATPase
MESKAPVDSIVVSLRKAIAVGFPIICLITHEESRALALIRSVAANIRTSVWTVTHGFDDESSIREPAAAIQYASSSSASPLSVFLDLHPFFTDPEVVRSLRDFAQKASETRRVAILLMPSAQIPMELEKDIAVIDLPLPSVGQLLQLCDAEHSRAKFPPPELDKDACVRAARGLTSIEAQRAFRLAMLSPDHASAVSQIIAEKRRVMRASSTLELVNTDVNLEQVGGLEVLKAWLKSRVVAFGAQAQSFGLPEPRGMLVCGIQGCGKSLVTKAAAKVFGLPLVRLDFASVFAASSPELALRQSTRITEAIAPVVLWVDEIEKGLSGQGADATHARVFGDFLIWLQEKRAPVFVAATANDVEKLPPELARRGRFDDIFFVDLPGVKEREDILAIHLTSRGRSPSDFPIATLTKNLEHFSGALFRAFAAGRDLIEEDIRVSASEIVPLATMYEEKVQALRTWAASRARRASADRRTLELFED